MAKKKETPTCPYCGSSNRRYDLNNCYVCLDCNSRYAASGYQVFHTAIDDAV